MTSYNERDIIRIFSDRLKIRELDDVASIGASYVMKCDMLVASTDVPAQMNPWQIARKSVVSSASDLASKGAKPIAAMISLGLPKAIDNEYVKGLADGFARASKEFGVKIVGGDTNEAAELVIDCCMLGRIATAKAPVRRGARPGDVVVVSGAFGLPPAGLAILMNHAKSLKSFSRRAVKSVLLPVPRQLFGTRLAGLFSSSIDSSDGLAISLYEIASNSKVDIALDRFPAASGVEKFAAGNGLELRELVFYGGEEYEIVATIPKRKIARARAIARKSGLTIRQIGIVRRGSGKVTLGGDTLENRGYLHFRR